MTETLVAGVVEGTAGEVVAGWAQLAKRPRRSAGGEVRVRTDDGRVVEVGISEAIVDPIERREAEWRELEQHAAARMCADDAPAPDVEVELKCVLVRGGDRIAAWGEVAEAALVQAGGFREGAEAAVSRLRARAVAIGPDAETRVEAVKAEHARREAQRTKEQQRVAAAAPKPAPTKLGAGIQDRLAVSWGLRCVGIGAAIGGVWCAVAPSYWIVPAIVAMCVLLAWPLVLDAMRFPPFRTLPSKPRRSLEIPGLAFILLGALAMMCAYGSGDLRVKTPGRAETAHFVAFGFAGAAFVAAAICAIATRGRRRMLRRIADAPPHPSPLADGVWGASDGKFVGVAGAPKVGGTSVAIALGEQLQWWGTATRVGTSKIRARNLSTTALEGFAPQLDLHAADGAVVPVELAGGWWYSTGKLTDSTGDDRAEQADVVEFGMPVRVVGRARKGTLCVGGDESLLLFASTDEIPRGLTRARRREQLSLGLAALGVVGWAVTLVLELVR